MRVLSLAIAMLFAIAANAQHVPRSTKASNGVKIGFYEFKPSDYGKARKQPLIIFLHGVGERGNGGSELKRVTKVGIAKMIEKGSNMRFTYKGRTESFVVLTPQLAKKYGAWQPFYIDAMIAYAKKNLDIDEDRIFITGLSLGGGGVWKYVTGASANASKIAGIVPICATCSMSNASYIAKAALPVWAFHARDDRRVGFLCTAQAIDRINALKPRVKAKETLFPKGGHSIWDRVYNPSNRINGLNIYEWFLSLKKGNGTPSASPDPAPAPKPVSKPKPIVKPAPVKKPSAPSKNLAPSALVSDATIVVKYPEESTVLDGSRSSDKDGSIVSFYWSKIKGPGSYDLANNRTSKTGVSKLEPGTYQFRLTVKDNDGATDQSVVTVKVVKTNKQPRADAGNATVIQLPENMVNLDGTGSQDADGRIVSYEWSYVRGPRSFHLVRPDSRHAAVNDLVAGEYTFRLTVRDNDGASDVSDVKVIVKKGDYAPEAVAGNDRITTGSAVTLDGSGSNDRDGKIVRYLWTKLEGPAATIVTENNKETRVTNLRNGNYVFRLRVWDNDGLTTTSDVTVKVR